MSTTSGQRNDVGQNLRVMRIILIALCLGVLSFATVVLVVSRGAAPDAKPLMAWIGLAFAVAAFLGRQFMRSFLEVVNRKGMLEKEKAGAATKSPEAFLWNIYQTRLIIGAALLEGACFFNLVCYMVEGQWWNLAVVGVFLAINASTYPTKDGVETWIQQQLELLELDRNQAN